MVGGEGESIGSSRRPSRAKRRRLTVKARRCTRPVAHKANANRAEPALVGAKLDKSAFPLDEDFKEF